MRAEDWSERPYLCSGSHETRKYTRTAEQIDNTFGHNHHCSRELTGPKLKTICCLRRVPERRRFPGGGSGSPLAGSFPLARLQRPQPHRLPSLGRRRAEPVVTGDRASEHCASARAPGRRSPQTAGRQGEARQGRHDEDARLARKLHVWEALTDDAFKSGDGAPSARGPEA